MPLLPLATDTQSGQPPTATAMAARAAAVNALGDGTLPIPEYPLVTDAAALTLTATRSVVIHYGSSPAAWTLPPVAAAMKYPLWLINRGPGVVTVQRAGTNMILRYNTAVTSVPIGNGGSLRLFNDGTYWVVAA